MYSFRICDQDDRLTKPPVGPYEEEAMENNPDLSTRCVHAGEKRDAEGPPHTPIFDTTTFGFRFNADLLDVVEGRRPGNLYTRYGLNPTIRSVEEKLASLENAEAAHDLIGDLRQAPAVL
jgi:O-acetylhomoserine/O-acetylserine sulfhydrylase-like pyridoxal-dependent enzyme